MAKTFGELLQEFRSTQVSRADLAARIHVSVSYLSLIENNKRLPKRHLVNDIADELKLSFEQRNSLLQAAEHDTIPSRPDVKEELCKILTDSELGEREMDLLVRELRAYARRWQVHRAARSKNVAKAVIVAAGWQARLLAPDKLETMILHAAKEAVAAGILEIIIIVAPSKSLPKFDTVRKVTKVDPKVVIQDEPLGLGHAILSTRSVIGEEPFAVILPVDVDPMSAALSEMKDCYIKERRPILAVNPQRASVGADFHHYGIAVLGTAVKGTKRLYYVDHMQEKTSTLEGVSEKARIIVGRYILTPDVFDFLQSTKRNPRTNKIELTDALEEFRKSHHFVCAYDLNRDLLPLASVRVMLEMLIESIGDPKKLAKMINLSRKTLEDLQKAES